MKKNSLIIAKSVLAVTVAASVLASANPADAAPSKAELAVGKAEKLGAELNKEITYEYRKAKYPKNPVGYPNMKLYSDTKVALADAKKAVAALKGKDKVVLSARLDTKVAVYVARTADYIDAVTAGLKVQKKANEFKTLYEKGMIDEQIVKVSSELKSEIGKSSSCFDRVYGATTRAQFKAIYIQPSEKQLNQLSIPLKMKAEIDKASAALDAGIIEDAAQHLGNVDYYVNEAAKKGQPKTDKLIAALLSMQKAVLTEFSKSDELYIAKSTNPNAPSTYGPATGRQLLSKNIYVYVGTKEHLKLQNIVLDGNIIILGTPGGAGNVSLENLRVYVGKIAVKNVGGNGLYLKGVQAVGINVDDADGFRIVADKSTKITSLSVNATSSDRSKSTLESLESGTFDNVRIDSYGSLQNQGTELKGNFSKTNIEIQGKNVRCTLVQGTEVNYLNFKAGAEVTISNSAKVNRMTKGTFVQGTVKVNNQGAIEKADRNIVVEGNAPTLVTNPIAKPGPDTGEVLPVVESMRVKTYIGNGTNFATGSYDPATDMTTVSLDHLRDSFILQGFEIKSPKAERFRITAIKGNPSYLYPKKNFPLEYTFTNGVLSLGVGDIWPRQEFEKSFLLSVFGKSMIIKGDLIDSNNKVNEINLKITW